MNMREQFVITTKELIEKDTRVSLILGGISVAAFSDMIMRYPKRVFNAGISEQAIVGVAAGMASTGMVPIVHTIAPFLVERAYEQLKIDFGYQKLGGVFVTTGASIDYSSFGSTHQCPADVGVLKQIPGMQIVVPGTAEELRTLFCHTYNNGEPTYIRTSRETNECSYDVAFGRANVIRKGRKATVVAVGPMLDIVLKSVEDLDVSILYYTTLEPFDRNTLKENCASEKIIVCVPFYEDTLLLDIINSMPESSLKIRQIGIPKEFVRHYGYSKEHYLAMGLTPEEIRKEILNAIG